ncbi:tautomerase family protein [Streptomyces sp. CAU 1734]|uniref:tautomerase family protein n=1 Tax=Streptomyces sp. CAU 1734 TaxID=3140360 RepID=UPI0032600ABB
MPHIHISHHPRNFTPQQLTDIDTALTEAVTRLFPADADAVSISLEPVTPEEWGTTVMPHLADQQGRDQLLRTPGYWNGK